MDLTKVNISIPPSSQTIIPIDQAPVKNNSSSSNSINNDVAGVLRRNQACLACRRRKLKCDAVRPHCGTCIRSYRHLLRTSPKSNPVLSCEYDDAMDKTAEPPRGLGGREIVSTTSGSVRSGDKNHHLDHSRSMESKNARSPDVRSTSAGDDDDDTKKKKRKATSQRRRKDDSLDDERDRLAKRVEELEKMLAKKSLVSDPDPKGTTFPEAANSPTAFLEMLSSAASARSGATSGAAPSGPNSIPVAGSMLAVPDLVPGMREGASAPTLMGSLAATWISADRSEPSGLTPLLNFVESPRPVDPTLSSSSSSLPNTTNSATGTVGTSSRTSNVDSRPSSSHHGFSAGSGATSDSSPTDQNVLSPGYVFNFSPAASGPTSSQWPPAVGPHGLQPNKLNDGPWRGIETVNSVFQGSLNNSNPANTGGVNTATNFFGTMADATIGSSSDSGGCGGDGGMPIDPKMHMDNLDDLQIDQALQQQILMDLFWPGWPINLPEPHIVTALVESFFDLVPNMPRLLHRPRFLARLALPPTHSNFPHPALIHAICACAASWCAPSIYEGSTRIHAKGLHDSRGLPTGPMSFGMRQAAHGKDAVAEGLNTGNRLFDVVRAMIILSRVFIDDTRMLECWAYCGLVARMILPLGLNVRSAELSLKSVMLPPAVDALEREERRAVVWMALYHDSIASAASGWGTSMSLEELTIPLPVSAKDFELGLENMEPNPQDLDSIDFWIKHPVVDPFVMTLKATIILNRVNRFVRRWKNRKLRDNDDLDGMQKPEFRELANAIACLQMSFPPSLRDPTRLNGKKRLDVDLISAHLIPQAAIICLYEPFADVTDPNDQPARRILGAAQAIIGTIQQIAGVVSDGPTNIQSIMHSSSSVALVTAARTILLFFIHARNIGDQQQAEAHRSDIEVARMALSQFGLRFKIGHHHSQLVEYFLDRASNPTYEKLQAHFPEHPRPGGPELTPTSHFGKCVLSALNVKRGYWKSMAGQSWERTPPQNSRSASGPVFPSSGYFQQNQQGQGQQQRLHTNSESSAGPSPFGTGSTPDSSSYPSTGDGNRSCNTFSTTGNPSPSAVGGMCASDVQWTPPGNDDSRKNSNDANTSGNISNANNNKIHNSNHNNVFMPMLFPDVREAMTSNNSKSLAVQTGPPFDTWNSVHANSSSSNSGLATQSAPTARIATDMNPPPLHPAVEARFEKQGHIQPDGHTQIFTFNDDGAARSQFEMVDENES